VIPLAVFLLGCVTVYAGTIQAAFGALMRLSLRLMAERGAIGSRLEGYLEDPPSLLVPLRLLIGLAVGVASALLALAIGVTGLRHASLVAVAVLVFVLVCEHVVPMFIVRRDPRRVLEVLLPSFVVLTAPLAPIARGLRRVLDRPRPVTAASAASIAPIPTDLPPAAVSNGGGGMESDERELLRSIVDFGDRLVREVMTPRPDIVAIQDDATMGELRAFFREQQYSRVPVYRESLDNVLGFVFVKDLIQRPDETPDAPITPLVRPAHFVPETKRVPELLRDFQRNQVQSAIVVDEYGGTAGLVTLEDLLEELVGEIRDEYDVETEAVVDEGGGSFVVSGKADVEDLAERLGIAIEGEGFETVGGYLLSHLGRVPVVGENFEVGDLSVEVLDAERRRIHKVRVRRREPVPSAEA
jgi:CBS domain containing-hemolysin-like protein